MRNQGPYTDNDCVNKIQIKLNQKLPDFSREKLPPSLVSRHFDASMVFRGFVRLAYLFRERHSVEPEDTSNSFQNWTETHGEHFFTNLHAGKKL